MTRTRKHKYNYMHGNDTYTAQNTYTPNVRPGYHCALRTDDWGSILGASAPDQFWGPGTLLLSRHSGSSLRGREL
jgi:hypothetical protein